MLFATDDAQTDRLVIDHPYFERHDPLVFDDRRAYVDTEFTFSATRTLEWNHGIGEIVSALLEADLQITTGLAEHDSVPGRRYRGR